MTAPTTPRPPGGILSPSVRSLFAAIICVLCYLCILPSQISAQSTAFSQVLDKFVGTGLIPRLEQGYAVALSSDGNTAVTGAASLAHPGGAWILVRTLGFWAPQALLKPSDHIGYSSFGTAVAISADGNTVAIAGPNDLSGTGAIFVFVRANGTIWTQQGSKLVPSPSTLGFGTSLALSADGNTLIAGSIYDNSNIGAGFVFHRTGTIWSQQAKVVGTGGTTSPRMGYVAISGDGNTVALGGTGDDSSKGAVWIFAQSSGVWTQQGNKLVPSGTIDQIGSALALSFDGNILAMSGVGETTLNNAVWVFERSVTTWSQVEKIVPYDLPSRGAIEFGRSLSISHDGQILAVGSPEDDQIGGLRVFERANGTWVQLTDKVVGTGHEKGSDQGFAVAISGDGTTISVGSPFDNRLVGATWFFTRSGLTITQEGSKVVLDDGGHYAYGFGNEVAIAPDGLTAAASASSHHFNLGGVWVFTRVSVGSSWTQQQLIIPEVTDVDDSPSYGASFAFSGDGKTLAFGAPSYEFKGAVYIYTVSGGVWTQQAKLIGTTSQTSPGPDQGTSVALSSDATTVVFGSPEDGSTGCVFIYNRSGITWTERASKLVGTGSVGSAIDQGRSVAISADGTTIAVGGPGDNSKKGAVWIFVKEGDGVFRQQTKLTDPDPKTNAHFGQSVKLSSDGNILVVGCYLYTSPGATLIFTRAVSTWTFKQRLVGSGATGGPGQGFSVDMSIDGKLVVTSGNFDGSSVGAIWAFVQEPNGTYVQRGNKMVAKDGSGALAFGTSISLSSNGKSLFVGAPSDNSSTGAVFSLDPTTFGPTTSPSKSPSRAPTPPTTMGPTTSPITSHPTQSPSRAPSSAPVPAPTQSPTKSPSRRLGSNANLDHLSLIVGVVTASTATMVLFWM